MSDLITKQCDQCKGLKKEVNHWWKATHYKELSFCVELSGINTLESKYLSIDLCSLECVHKWLDRWTAEQQNQPKTELAFDLQDCTFNTIPWASSQNK